VQPEVRAGRPDALAALAPNGGKRPLLPLVLAPRNLHLNALARQRAFDEDSLAVSARDAATFLVQGFDFERLHVSAAAESKFAAITVGRF
jgi:hypothetical protein